MDTLIHLLSVSRRLERVADHATNIAEDVIYLVEGRIVRHIPERPQGQGHDGRTPLLPDRDRKDRKG